MFNRAAEELTGQSAAAVVGRSMDDALPAALARLLRAARDTGRRHTEPELALAAVTELAGFPGVILAALATDGEDGPTDAAGAVVDGGTFRRAAALGLHPVEYLERNDSYSFFAALGDLLKPGPTGTNVNDLIFLFTLPA